jgi:hypothetical protein
MKYTETQLFANMRKLRDLYLESFPDDSTQVERFLKWAHTQFGYEYVANSKKDN